MRLHGQSLKIESKSPSFTVGFLLDGVTNNIGFCDLDVFFITESQHWFILGLTRASDRNM